jgi:putative inorganic carbon (HCO3(-)) transporter
MSRLLVLNLRLALPKLLLALLIVVLGAALALLPVKWAAALIASGVVVFALLVRPQYAPCLLAFAVPFGSIRQLPVGPVNVGLTEVLLVLLLASWVARVISVRRIVLPRAPLVLPLLLFLLAMMLSILGTVSLELSAKEAVKWLAVLFIYWFMVDMVDQRWGRLVVWALLAAGSAEALVGIYQFLRRVGPEGFILLGRFMRAHGHFAQPNPFAGYIGLSLPLAYALALEAMDAWRLQARQASVGLGRRLAQLLPHAAAVVAFVVMSTALVMSWSRGGWVGAAAALVAVTVMRSRRALFTAVALALVAGYLLLVGGAQYLPSTVVQRFADFLPYLGGVDVTAVEVTDANWAVIERMAHWQAALGMFTDHPWLGVGMGNYPVAYPRYALGRWQDPLGHAHNYYLNIAAEAGVVGLGAYLFLFAACLAQAWRVIRRLRPEALLEGQGDWRAVALGAMGVLVHLSVHNIFDNLFVHNMHVQLALMLGLLFVAERSMDA